MSGAPSRRCFLGLAVDSGMFAGFFASIFQKMKLTPSISFFAVFIAFLSLMGCDGGSAPPAPPPLATFQPAHLDAEIWAGQSSSVDITVLPAIDPGEEPLFIGLDEGSMAHITGMMVLPMSEGRYVLRFQTPRNLAEGEYSGTLSIYMCPDSACYEAYEGSPLLLPYHFTAVPPPPVLTMGTTVISGTVYQHESPSLAFEIGTDITRVHYEAPLNYVDETNGITFTEDAYQLGLTRKLWLQLPADIPGGRYQGVLRVDLCDSGCTYHYPGSPLRVPYDFTVVPSRNLTPLTPLAGAGDWTTVQGNAAHTGHVPVTLDPALFNPRWRWAPPIEEGKRSLKGPATADGQVYVSHSYITRALYSLREADGTLAWTSPDLGYGRLFPPAATAGKVYAIAGADTYGNGGPLLHVFDSAGNLQRSQAVSGQFPTFLAPTLIDDKVYTSCGYYGGVCEYLASSPTTRFWQLPQFDAWAPAVDDNAIYMHVGNEFRVIKRSDGTTLYSHVDGTFAGQAYSMNSASVLAHDGSVVVVQQPGAIANQMRRYDPSGNRVVWTVSGAFAANPVVAGDVIYTMSTVSPPGVEARSLATGELLWRWVSPVSYPGKQLIVTNNILFIGTASDTRALDLSTRQEVWKYPHEGQLGLSANGVLYIIPYHVNSQVYAINLR